jgi:HlyD family secretion protein
MQKRKRFLILVVAVIVISLIAAEVWWRQRQGPAPRELVLYGNVDVRQIALAFNGNGRVVQMRVIEGDRVRAGELLAALDKEPLQLRVARAEAQLQAQQQVLRRLESGSRPEEVAQAQASVAAAKAQASSAVQQLDRLQAISRNTNQRGVSREQLDLARANQQVAQAQLENARKALELVVAGPRQEDIEQARAQLAAAEAELALVRYELREADLKAPLDAVVRSRLLEPGDMASPQQPAYTLALTRPKWVRAYINEADLGRVRPGQTAQVVTDSYPKQPVAGQVGYISSVAEFTPKTVQTEELRTSLVYEIRIVVDDPDDRLRLGMPVTVHLPVAEQHTAAGYAQP